MHLTLPIVLRSAHNSKLSRKQSRLNEGELVIYMGVAVA